MEKERSKKDKFIASLYLLPSEGKGLTTQQIQQQYGIGNQRLKAALERLGLSDKFRSLSEVQKQRFIDNPYLKEDQRDRMSKRMKEQWKEWGGLEGRLKLLPTRDQAVQLLNNVIHGIINTEGNSRQSVLMHQKYIQIINNHTYPDEVQQSLQSQPV